MLEIERKFLVNDLIHDVLKDSVPKSLVQGYLSKTEHGSVRIRTEFHPHYVEPHAYLMSKTKIDFMSNQETVDEIEIKNAEVLLSFCHKVVRKERHLIGIDEPDGKYRTWEVDVFLQPNTGLILAEIELNDANELIWLPPWIDREVTGIPEYYNVNM